MAGLTTLPPHVHPDMLDPAFWLARIDDPDAPVIAADTIAVFNGRVYDTIALPAIRNLPEALPAGEVRAAMQAYVPNRTLYTAEGHPVEPDAFERVLEVATPELPDPVPVAFGLAVQRTDVRAFPTAGVITSRPFDYALDRIQETTIDIGWPVAILGTSQDGHWHFCLTPHYWGWVRAAHIARAPRRDLADFTAMDPFVVTTANRGLVSLGAEGGITPQMGTRLPYHPGGDDLWLVAVPLRDADGSLRFASGFIPSATTTGDFAAGYLPPTPRSLITQAFKLLGEPYAWGGTRLGIFGRDCSRLVRDVYATTGVLLPRNGDQQGAVGCAQVTFTPDMPVDARRAAIVDQVSPGAIFELPGHVMLYLGAVEGNPFVIHDTSSSGYDGVIVSDLSLGAESESGSLLARLTRAVTVG